MVIFSIIHPPFPSIALVSPPTPLQRHSLAHPHTRVRLLGSVRLC
jgi:hypothetical protein